MRYLTKGVYYCEASKPVDGACAEIPGMTKPVKMWHDCKHGRTRLAVMTENEDSALFECPKCGFKYVLDKHLKLR